MSADAAAALEKDETPAAPPRADVLDAYVLAGKAFEHIQQYQTPPLPSTYSLWYSYVSGENSELVARVDDALARNDTLSLYDICEISSSYAPSDAAESAQQEIGREFENEIANVLGLIEDSVKNSDSLGAALEGVEDVLPNNSSTNELQSAVAALITENRRMAGSARDLNEGLKESQKQIERLNRELEEVQNQSLLDPLTRVANRRAFERRIKAELDQVEELGGDLCLVLADIDHFKRVNDTFGHPAGDHVLREFALIVQKHVKGQDMVARYGGEEFAVILPKTDIFAALNLMVRVKQEIERTQFSFGDPPLSLGRLTASFGISAFKPGCDVPDLISRADSKLYEAKNGGRNLVKAEGIG